MAKLIDGKKIARKLQLSVSEKIEKASKEYGLKPKLVSITVGSQDESAIYVKMQERAALEVGIEFQTFELSEDVSEEKLVAEIQKLNEDSSVTAVIVQQPLPKHIDHYKVITSILPKKDAEGVHPYNLGRILRRDARIVPCTPGAVMKILRELDEDLYGKEVVLIGHSPIVGKPLSLMMLNEFATTTVCHIATAEKGDLTSHTKMADILVVAVGKAEMVKADWVKAGAVVIDVGINNVEGKIVGDVSFEEVEKKASAITPVPGGVGPITVSILMRNVFRAFEDQHVNIKG